MDEPEIEWRLIVDEPGAPAWNMALDEALLECRAPGDAPVLRLYGWQPAALSLGRFQPARDVVCPPGAVLVRRISGGAAIHHRVDEVTYALIAPYARFGGARAAYHAVHDAIARALVSLGVPVSGREEGERVARTAPRGMCFASPTAEDLVVRGRKLVGSAQRRRGDAFLQHGSIPVSPDPRAEGSTSLAELVSSPPPRETIVAALINAMRHTLGSEPTRCTATPRELYTARRLYEARYTADPWTHER